MAWTNTIPRVSHIVAMHAMLGSIRYSMQVDVLADAPTRTNYDDIYSALFHFALCFLSSIILSLRLIRYPTCADSFKHLPRCLWQPRPTLG